MFDELEGWDLAVALEAAGPAPFGTDSDARLEETRCWGRVESYITARRIRSAGAFIVAAAEERESGELRPMTDREEYARALNLSDGRPAMT